MENKLTVEEIKKFATMLTLSGGRIVGKTIQLRMSNELLEYKQIEQELGIKLNVLFKARNGFYVHGDYKEIVEVADDLWINIVSEMLGGTVIETDDLGKGQVLHVYRHIKDYGKTWALSKEELKK